MNFYVSAMVVYSDSIEAETEEEEAIDAFIANCPFDVDAQTIECEIETEE